MTLEEFITAELYNAECKLVNSGNMDDIHYHAALIKIKHKLANAKLLRSSSNIIKG